MERLEIINDTTDTLANRLKMWGVKLVDAALANVLLSEKGILFKDGKGDWRLTEYSKEFGEELEGPPTSIRWYFRRFGEVLDKIGLRHYETPNPAELVPYEP